MAARRSNAAKSPVSASARMGSRWDVRNSRAALDPPRLAPAGQAAAPVHRVRRAVEMACANNACIAAVMSPSVVTVKNMPVEAQLCRLGPIWFWNGATQLLYQELVVSGRYSV